MNEPTHAQLIEAVLFYEGGTLDKKELQKYLSLSDEELNTALSELSQNISGRGVTLVHSDTDVSLRIEPSCMKAVQTIHEGSLASEIGPASLETLGILIYRGPSSQAEIDAIRGVQSTFALRNLRIRGMIDRKVESGKTVYTPTADALAHLGVTDVTMIPGYETVRKEITQWEEKNTQQQTTQQEDDGGDGEESMITE
jgi:segregation and condensation protein B